MPEIWPFQLQSTIVFGEYDILMTGTGEQEDMLSREALTCPFALPLPGRGERYAGLFQAGETVQQQKAG